MFGVSELAQIVKALAIGGGAMVLFFVFIVGPDRLLDALGDFFGGIADSMEEIFDGLGSMGRGGELEVAHILVARQRHQDQPSSGLRLVMQSLMSILNKFQVEHTTARQKMLRIIFLRQV